MMVVTISSSNANQLLPNEKNNTDVIQSTPTLDPETENLVDYPFYHHYTRLLLLFQHYLHGAKALTWDLSFPNIKDILFGSAFIKAYLPRWMTTEVNIYYLYINLFIYTYIFIFIYILTYCLGRRCQGLSAPLADCRGNFLNYLFMYYFYALFYLFIIYNFSYVSLPFLGAFKRKGVVVALS